MRLKQNTPTIKRGSLKVTNRRTIRDQVARRRAVIERMHMYNTCRDVGEGCPRNGNLAVQPHTIAIPTGTSVGRSSGPNQYSHVAVFLFGPRKRPSPYRHLKAGKLRRGRGATQLQGSCICEMDEARQFSRDSGDTRLRRLETAVVCYSYMAFMKDQSGSRAKGNFQSLRSEIGILKCTLDGASRRVQAAPQNPTVHPRKTRDSSSVLVLHVPDPLLL